MASNRQDLPPGFYWNGDKPFIYADIWIGGRRFGKSTGTTSLREAKKRKQELQAELINSGDAIMPTKGGRVNELLDDYLEHLKTKEENKAQRSAYVMSGRTNSDRVEGFMKRLRPHFGKKEHVTTDSIKQYVTDRRKAGAGVITVNRELSTLRTALNQGTKTTPRKVNPGAIPDFTQFIDMEYERNARRTGFMTHEQYETIMAELAPHMKPILATTVWTGIRPKELRFLRPSQVDLDAKLIHLNVGETKNGKARTVGINDELFEILLAWKQTTEREFPEADRFFHFRGLPINDWKSGWQAAMKRAGMEGVKFYDARRTAATWNENIGVAEGDNQKMMGHSLVSMTRQYSQSKQAAINVVEVQNEAISRSKSRGASLPTTPAPVAPTTPVSDLKGKLAELKGLFDDGLLPEDIYKAQVTAALTGR